MTKHVHDLVASRARATELAATCTADEINERLRFWRLRLMPKAIGKPEGFEPPKRVAHAVLPSRAPIVQCRACHDVDYGPWGLAPDGRLLCEPCLLLLEAWQARASSEDVEVATRLGEEFSRWVSGAHLVDRGNEVLVRLVSYVRPVI
jgi:hypothetical protein